MNVDQEPLGFRWRGFPPLLSLLMPTFSLPHAPADLPVHLHRLRNAPLPIPLLGSHSFGSELMPENFRRRDARPVSYYALFKGMAASKPTSWLSRHPNLL
jgi:hypothetical protein